MQVGMILYEGGQVMYSVSSEAFLVTRQPKAHGSLKGLQETRLVFSIQKSLSVTIGTICESVCATDSCSRMPCLAHGFFFLLVFVCTCSLHLLVFPMSRPLRLIAAARVVRLLAGG